MNQELLNTLCAKLREFDLENRALYSPKDYDDAARKYWTAMYFDTIPSPKNTVPHKWKNVYDEQGRFMRVELVSKGKGQFSAFDYSSFASQLEHLDREAGTLTGIHKAIIDFHKRGDWEAMTTILAVYNPRRKGDNHAGP